MSNPRPTPSANQKYYAERYGRGEMLGITSQHGPFTSFDDAVAVAAAKAADGFHDVEIWRMGPNGREQQQTHRMVVQNGRLSEPLVNLWNNEPVLPPGCRLVPSQVGGFFVMDARSRALTEGPTAARVAADAWYQFGTFMSREDYEALAAADLREKATDQMYCDARRACEEAEREMDSVRSLLETAGEEETNIEAAARVVRERNDAKQEVDRLRSKVVAWGVTLGREGLATPAQRDAARAALLEVPRLQAEIDKLNERLAKDKTLRMAAEAEARRSYTKVNQVITNAATDRERLLTDAKLAETRAKRAETLVNELRGRLAACQKIVVEREAERDAAVAIQDRLRGEMAGQPWVDLDDPRRQISALETELSATELLDRAATAGIHKLRAGMGRLRSLLDDITEVTARASNSKSRPCHT